MSKNWVLRVLLFPVSIIYGGIVVLRNWLYRYGLLKSVRFNIPVISFGNLSVGGTGKTPHAAHVLQLLQPRIKMATMSRGYGRKSSGFRVITLQDTASTAGDEALLLKFKFPSVTVTVSEDRATGVPKLLGHEPGIQALVLDDAFQHRAVTPYLNFLLTCFNDPFFKDWLIPTGRLREWRSAHVRADAIIVTKCPDHVSEEERSIFIDQLEANERPVFFTKYEYDKPYFLFNNRYRLDLNKETSIILLSGIAGTDYLLSYLELEVDVVYNYAFRDHHDFSDRDVGQLELMFTELKATKKAILCTEKDAVRLIKHKKYLIEKKLPLFVLPVRVRFLFGQNEEFHSYITNRLLEFKS